MSTKQETKTETVEQFLARGGSIKKCPKPEYKSSGKFRYKMKDLKGMPG